MFSMRVQTNGSNIRVQGIRVHVQVQHVLVDQHVPVLGYDPNQPEVVPRPDDDVMVMARAAGYGL